MRLVHYCSSLTSKGQQACQAAETRIGRIQRRCQAEEDQALTNMKVWEPSMSQSRPGSGIEKAELVYIEGATIMQENILDY